MKFKILKRCQYSPMLLITFILLMLSHNLLAMDKQNDIGHRYGNGYGYNFFHGIKLSDFFPFKHRGNRPANPGIYSQRYSNHILRGVRLSDVYANNFTETTLFGPAYANVWLEKSNFLACLPPSGRKISYALCYYSGPDQPTGNNPDNPSLPCELTPDGIVANCTCYEISTELFSPKIPYYVDINAISNLDIYNKTIEACGKDGLKCASGEIIPPVCDAINTNLLVPGADAISVFSPIFIENYLSSIDIATGNTSTSCENGDAALYAGCMTAPCYATGEKDAQGRDLMECKCPVYDGPFQIGQSDQNCDANDPPPVNTTKSLRKIRHKYPRNVWSAAYNPNGGPITIPSGACVPDLPGQQGCDLYDSGKDYTNIINPDGALCSQVCASYGNSTVVSENQVGYTCDATLCTTLGIGQDDSFNPSASAQAELMSESCKGIEKMGGMQQVLLVEALAECSCCASQVCGCDNINPTTDQQIYDLNQQQRDATIEPQCDINGTLCGTNNENGE